MASRCCRECATRQRGNLQPNKAELGGKVKETLVRVALGGALVSIFAAAGDLLKPKSFAGLFGAAPSIALATLLLTVTQHGTAYAGREARSMVWGAIAFCLCASVASWLLMRHKCSARLSSGMALAVWLALALGQWFFFLR